MLEIILRWIKRILIAVAAIALALVLLLSTILLVRYCWQREWVPADANVELNSKWPILKLSDVPPNSAFALLHRAAQAESSVPRPPDVQKELIRLSVEPWTDSSFPILAKLLRENKEALELARLAARTPNPQVPTYMSLTDQFPYMTPVMRLNELFRASAAQKAAAGDLAGAYSELETSIAFAQVLSRGGVLIHALVEMTCDMQAYKSMRLIALQNAVPPEVASNAIKRLRETSRTVEPLAETFRAEYRAVPGIVDMFFDPSKPSILGPMEDEKTAASEHRFRLAMHDFGWLVGSTRPVVTADLTRVYKCLIKASDDPYQAQEMQHLDKTLVPPIKPRDWPLLRDPVGYVLARILLPVYPGIIVRYHRRAADLAATGVVIAACQFEQAEHRPPTSLQELVPKYMPDIPLDPFDGAPLRYHIRPNGKWIVYSVGPNQIDEDGEQPKVDPHNYTDSGDVIFCECEVDVARERNRRQAK
jgi:hypothetical protein